MNTTTPVPPNPLDEVIASPAYKYWRESDDRVKQFWYVSFCLMMSSVQDRLTGLALRESGNLNWATTAFYYSGVHAGRLVCFICFGDFPTKHANLAKLLSPAGRSESLQRVRLNWLQKFQENLAVDHGSRGTRHTYYPTDSTNREWDRETLVGVIDRALPDVRSAFDRFAPLLAGFKTLREDCNYESLLVAHESNHFMVTDAFNDLVVAADRASRIAADLVAATYIGHLKAAGCFAAHRSEFHSAHTHYLTNRFNLSLGEKFQRSPNALKELLRIQHKLAWPGSPSDISLDDLDEFLGPIRYGAFGAKSGLMQRWRDDIYSLQRTLPVAE